MKENWEIHWKDYYKILQVQPSAEPEVIEAAYDKLARKYHPDINNTTANSQKMKDINEAYEILSKPEKRSRYDLVYSQNGENLFTEKPTEKPKPILRLNPTIIHFRDLKPGETRRESFIIENTGAPFTKISISKPNSWFKIVGQRSLSETGILPLEMEIEATGEDWCESCTGNVVVKLDEVEAHVRIELTTVPEPLKARQKHKPERGGLRQYPDFWEWLMEGEHRILIINPLIAYIVYLLETRNSD